MERISCAEVDEEAFIEQFERPNVPAVITDSQTTWEANRKWNFEVHRRVCVRVCVVPTPELAKQ